MERPNRTRIPSAAQTAALRADPEFQSLSQALNGRIRQLLRAQRWSQREFAMRLGVTQGAVSYLLAEKRRATVLDYYAKLARIFGVRLSVLIADLEHLVEQDASEGVVPAHAAAPALFVAPPTPTPDRHKADVLHAYVQAILDAQVDAANARIDARVEAGLAQLDAHSRQEAVPRPAAPRRRAAAKKRPHRRAAPRPPAPAGADVHEALPARRDPPDRSLRTAG